MGGGCVGFDEVGYADLTVYFIFDLKHLYIPFFITAGVGIEDDDPVFQYF